MSMPIVCLPPLLKEKIGFFRGFFSKPQFKHFERLVSGFIVSNNKTLQVINDSFGDGDQSSFNRFVTTSDFDIGELDSLRLDLVKKEFSLTRKGCLVIDESLTHKTGRKMDLVGLHRSGVTKKIELGHMLVNSFYVDLAGNEFPVKTSFYVREGDCEKNGVSFKTKRELAIEQMDFALKNSLPVRLVSVDAGYEGEEFTKEIKSRGLDFIIGVRKSSKFSFERKQRIDVGTYLESLNEKDFTSAKIDFKEYFYHIKKVYMRGIGKVKLVISYPKNEEENIKYYITNLNESETTIIHLLIKRWRIECFHRDAKQHLGLEAYQVRKGRGIQVVVPAILIAYTLVKICAKHLKTPIRPLKTIGEICRYLALIAYKGIKWFRNLIKKPLEFIKTLKRLVFTKTAKV